MILVLFLIYQFFKIKAYFDDIDKFFLPEYKYVFIDKKNETLILIFIYLILELGLRISKSKSSKISI